MACVLTLPATGSESNAGAVVTRDGNKLPFFSPLVRPLFAVLDPAVTLSLSDRQISNGVVDAFVHTMEQYLTYSVNGKVQDRFAEGLLLTLIEEGPKALAADSTNDLEVRGNIMWAATMALNGLIGAADGAKFRRFAQGLTLSHLVYLANEQLNRLHGRYQLQRQQSDSLALEVLDTWQADSVRDTKTLSGGESFLVSLALALALSDLVSAKTSIDSLFLDEGFGTLDNDTLEIALSALDSLNASGKMIGVISHVDALKKRIDVQIEVKKHSGLGVSELEERYRYHASKVSVD